MIYLCSLKSDFHIKKIMLKKLSCEYIHVNYNYYYKINNPLCSYKIVCYHNNVMTNM